MVEANHLSLNIEKKKFVLFRSPRHKFDSQIILKLGNRILAGSHILLNFRRNSRTVGLFYKIRHYAPLERLKLLYHGIFYPFISFGIQVWGLTYKSYLDPVSILQKKALKAITFNDRRSSQHIYFVILICLRCVIYTTFKLLPFYLNVSIIYPLLTFMNTLN